MKDKAYLHFFSYILRLIKRYQLFQTKSAMIFYKVANQLRKFLFSLYKSWYWKYKKGKGCLCHTSPLPCLA